MKNGAAPEGVRAVAFSHRLHLRIRRFLCWGGGAMSDLAISNHFRNKRIEFVANSFDIVETSRQALLTVKMIQSFFVRTEIKNLSFFVGEPTVDLNEKNITTFSVVNVKILNTVVLNKVLNILFNMFRIATNHAEGVECDFCAPTTAAFLFCPVDI